MAVRWPYDGRTVAVRWPSIFDTSCARSESYLDYMNNLSRHRGSSLKQKCIKNRWPPYGHRTATVWPPYGHRMATEWPPYGQPHAVHDAFERGREASVRTLWRQSLHHAGHKKEANKHKEREGRLVRLSTCSPKQLQQKLKQRFVNTE